MLWILKKKPNQTHPNPWTKVYDTLDGCVVRAPDETTARTLASKIRGDEGSNVWLDSWFTTCLELSVEGDSEVVLDNRSSR